MESLDIHQDHGNHQLSELLCRYCIYRAQFKLARMFLQVQGCIRLEYIAPLLTGGSSRCFNVGMNLN